ncbi:cilia- and flagella-associated protein 157-like [Palaemon carinicauda]|uniref:cilia- and flagella-associated protein 157-like n=1 Tax=Palaemon carinicauda TaxID=392227 RepID=UPI0035B6971A
MEACSVSESREDKMGGKNGGKKKGKKKVKKDEEDEKPKEEISELDKAYYLNQIQSLETKVRRSTTRCQQLDDAERHARAQYDKLQQDKTDIIKFLKDRLTARGDEVEELRSRLAGLVKAKQAEKDHYEVCLIIVSLTIYCETGWCLGLGSSG